MLLTWLFHDSLLSMLTLKYLAFSATSSFSQWMVYSWLMIFFLLVGLTTWHLLGCVFSLQPTFNIFKVKRWLGVCTSGVVLGLDRNFFLEDYISCVLGLPFREELVALNRTKRFSCQDQNPNWISTGTGTGTSGSRWRTLGLEGEDHHGTGLLRNLSWKGMCLNLSFT